MADQPPTFRISAQHSLSGEKPLTYEVTNHLIGVQPSDAISLTWELEVEKDYSGNEDYGEVVVHVRDKRGNPLAENRWQHLTKDSTSLAVALDPYKLASYVPLSDLKGGFTENPFDGEDMDIPEATFDVVVSKAGN